MSAYLSHIYSKESEKDSSKKKEDEANQPGRSSQPKDQSSMPKPTKKPKDLDKWIEKQIAKNAKADGNSAMPKRLPPAGKSAGATQRAKSPPLPPKDLKPKMGKKALENSNEEGVTHDKRKKKPRQESVAPANEGAGAQKPRKKSNGRLNTTASGGQGTLRPKDKETAKSKETSVPESPEAADSGSEDSDPLNCHTKYPLELTSQDADIAARYRQRLQALCRTIDDDSSPPDPDRSKDEEDDELLGVFKEVSDQVEEVRKWMRMVDMDWEAFEKLQERAEREGVEGAEEEGDVEDGEVLEEIGAGNGVEGGGREDEGVRFSGGLERIEEEKTDELDVVAERERQVSDQVRGGETPGYRSSPSQSPHLPSDDETYRTEPQGPAATESNLLMDEEQDLSDQVQRGETPGYLSSSSQSPAQLPSDDESQQGSSERFQGRETPDNPSSSSRSPAELPSDDESQQGSLDQLEEIPEYLLNPLEGSPQPPPNNEVGSTEPQGGAAPQGVLSSILRSLQQHADKMSRNDPHASSAGPAGHNDGRAAGTVDQTPEALEQETGTSQASVGNRPQDTSGAATLDTDSAHEHDEVDDLFSEDVMGPVEVSPEIEASPRFETTTELPRSDVSVLDGNEGTFEPHARPPNTSLPGLGLYLPSTTTAAGSSVETSAGPTANLPGLHYGQGVDARAQPNASASGTVENGSQHAVDSQSSVAANAVVADGSIGTEHDRPVEGQSSPSRATKRKSTSDDEKSPRKKSRSNSPTETQFR
ncbi:hypothetical protein KC333_g4168 [Hortaea werneckii]|nr:hypothetical protein KC333_g4168 [Hortaea werneckii]KAI7316975.1 hypothetical protein KC326_g4143 [Hortaea werneckii]